MKKISLIILAFILGYTGLCQKNKFKIGVDERVELMTTIQLICKTYVMTLTGADLRYEKEVTATFGKYADNPAVVTFDSINYKYFSFEMPFQFMLHYTLPNFKLIAPVASSEFAPVRNYEKHTDTLSHFIEQLKDFYEVSHFHDFFMAHKIFYDSLRNDVTSTLSGKNMVPVLEKYYGQSFNSYNLVLSPLSLDGGFGVTFKNKSKYYVYAIIGPAYTSKGYPEFKKSKTVVIHEMSHPFSNPVVDSCWSAIEKDTCLYNPVIKDMQKEGYWGWKAVVYETLNRANEVILTSNIFGETESKKLNENYISKKYIYLPLCMRVLEIYQADRNKYSTITSIKDLLIQAFEEEKNKNCR